MGYVSQRVHKEGGKRELNYVELAEHFDSSSAIVKAKINFLRKQTWSRNGKRIKNKKWSGYRQKVR